MNLIFLFFKLDLIIYLVFIHQIFIHFIQDIDFFGIINSNSIIPLNYFFYIYSDLSNIISKFL